MNKKIVENRDRNFLPYCRRLKECFSFTVMYNGERKLTGHGLQKNNKIWILHSTGTVIL